MHEEIHDSTFGLFNLYYTQELISKGDSMGITDGERKWQSDNAA
jgi:hypothetical protein